MKSTLLEKSGFFPEYYLNVVNQSTPDELESIGKCKDDLSRVQHLNSLPFIKASDLKIEKDLTGKSLEIASKMKESGNAAFKAKKWLDAMILYSQSLIAVPLKGNEEFASIVVANRSAALYHMNKFEDCLKDVARAFKLGYPKDKSYKLYEREAQSHLGLKNNEPAIAAFKKAVSAVDDANLPTEKTAKTVQDFLVMVKLLEKDPSTKKQSVKKSDLLSKTLQDEKEFMSESVRIDSNETEGRFGVAARDIKIGEELIVEKPGAAVLLQEYSKTHCQHCFIRVAIPVTCPNCVEVVFCSEKCQEISLNTYHKHECGLLQTIWKSGASINCHLAFRIISSKSYEYFLKIKDKIDVPMTPEEMRKLKSDDYLKVCQMVTHADIRSNSNFFQHTLMSRFLTLCLKEGGFFEGVSNPEEAFLLISSLMLRNLQFIQYNAHEISELHYQDNKETTVFIGAGTYPNLAMLNHACDPSVVRYFRGNRVHVNAIKPIASGLQIHENYGPIYTQEKCSERKAKLRELYNFECQCDPCIEDWPVYDELVADKIRFRCDSDVKCRNIIEISPDCNEIMVKCFSCNQFTNILKGLKVMQDIELMIRTGRRLYESKEFSKALQKFIDCLRIMDEVLAPPFQDYASCQQNIKDCFIHFGNCYNI